MRIVIDTNVVASAIFFGGKPRELLELLMRRQVDAYASPEIISEYQETCDELISRYPVKPVLLPLNQIIYQPMLLSCYVRTGSSGAYGSYPVPPAYPGKTRNTVIPGK